jgi:hypothetical protein
MLYVVGDGVGDGPGDGVVVAGAIYDVKTGKITPYEG